MARLSALCRLAMGAAHSLNNAFTAVVGEASFLREDRKQDALVVEACDNILASLERCARITRALLSFRQPSQSSAQEADLGRLLRELGALLQETLGSAHCLSLEVPDDLLLARGDPEVLELALLSLLHYAADHAGGPAQLQLHLEAAEGEGDLCIELEVRSARLPDYAAAAPADPALAPDALTRASLRCLAQVISGLGGSLHTAPTGPDAWRTRLRLPRAA